MNKRNSVIIVIIVMTLLLGIILGSCRQGAKVMPTQSNETGLESSQETLQPTIGTDSEQVTMSEPITISEPTSTPEPTATLEPTPSSTPVPTNTPMPTSSPTPEPTTEPANINGNTIQNLSKGSMITSQGEWLYFQNTRDQGFLYKMKKDGSNLTKLESKEAFNINVIGEWVYYTASVRDEFEGDYYRLMKTRTDGSQTLQIGKDVISFAAIVNGWIYYTKSSNPEGYAIYKMKTDGTSDTKLASDRTGNMHIEGDWIYYSVDPGGSIYKMKTDGSQRQKLVDKAYNMMVFGEWIIYGKRTDIDTYSYFHRIKTDGTGDARIREGYLQSAIPVGEWIYYVERDGDKGYISKVKLNGSEYERITECSPYGRILSLDGWLYFIVDSNQGFRGRDFYKMKEDGSSIQPVVK